jgi:hypothetical protein
MVLTFSRVTFFVTFFNLLLNYKEIFVNTPKVVFLG